MSDTVEDDGRFWQVLAVNIAAGCSIKAASEVAGCSERTGYRIAAEPKFRQSVAQTRAEIASVAVGRLTSAATEAVDTLRELLGSTNEPKTRLDACKLILGSLGQVAEHCELRGRLDSLERGE